MCNALLTVCCKYDFFDKAIFLIFISKKIIHISKFKYVGLILNIIALSQKVTLMLKQIQLIALVSQMSNF